MPNIPPLTRQCSWGVKASQPDLMTHWGQSAMEKPFLLSESRRTQKAWWRDLLLWWGNFLLLLLQSLNSTLTCTCACVFMFYIFAVLYPESHLTLPCLEKSHSSFEPHHLCGATSDFPSHDYPFLLPASQNSLGLSQRIYPTLSFCLHEYLIH